MQFIRRQDPAADAPRMSPAGDDEGEGQGTAAPDGDAYLTLREAASRVGVSPAALRVQITRGRLRTIKRGRERLTTAEWLDEYQRRSRVLQGRPRHLPPVAEEFTRRLAWWEAAEPPRTLEEREDLARRAGMETMLIHPLLRADELRRAVEEVWPGGEVALDARERRRAVDRVVSAILTDARVRDQRYDERRAAFRRSPESRSASGARWNELFWLKVAALAGDPREQGVMGRLDREVAEDLAREALARGLAARPLEVRRILAHAMFEGSENLPGGSYECRQRIDITVTAALRTIFGTELAGEGSAAATPVPPSGAGPDRAGTGDHSGE